MDGVAGVDVERIQKATASSNCWASGAAWRQVRSNSIKLCTGLKSSFLAMISGSLVEHSPLFQNAFDERIAHRQPLLDFLRRIDDEIRCEAVPDQGIQFSDSIDPELGDAAFHDEQVDVRSRLDVAPD